MKMVDVPQAQTIKLELDCAVCLQKCQHPTQLPCGHIFCFLCVKGVAFQSRKCAMCRTEIPLDYLDNPILLDKPCLLTNAENVQEGYQWYYEGRNGWWKYDERSNTELETAVNADEPECTLLLAGALYIVDFQTMIQVRRSDQSRRRRVRRDTPLFPAKGIAGIKTETSQIKETKSETEENSDAIENNHINDEIIEIGADDENVINVRSESDQNITEEYNTELASIELDAVSNIVDRISVMNLQDPGLDGDLSEHT